MPGQHGALILTPSELSNIRKYVQHKFAGLPQERHAEIVADAVHRIIMKQLPEFDPAVKRLLTDVLVRTTVLEERRPVSTEDIFNACMSLELDDDVLTAPLLQWFNSRMHANWVKEDFLDVIRESEAGTSDLPRMKAWETLVRLSAERSASVTVNTESEFDQASPVTGSVVRLFPATRNRIHPIIYGLSSLFLIGGLLCYPWLVGMSMPPEPETKRLVWEWMPKLPTEMLEPRMPNELPRELQYATVNLPGLRQYLEEKSSLLAETPYFEAIVETAKANNIHPVLLFAITGQEQSFVPKDHRFAGQIANNPFNVFNSWKKYNTTIHDSAEIAARTVLKWSKNRPDGIDAIQWINRKYAEDQNWHKGVRSLFDAMLRYIQLNESKNNP
ncbi:hypothetical protein AB6A23_14185 [Paenibacillus tarimensis]